MTPPAACLNCGNQSPYWIMLGNTQAGIYYLQRLRKRDDHASHV